MMKQRPFRFGVVAARAVSGAAWIAHAQRVEALGYATLLVPDRLGRLLSPLAALAVAAATTQTLRLGTFVLANGVRERVRAIHRVELDQLLQAPVPSPLVVTGAPDAMCEQLLERRECLGVSYVTVPDDQMEVFAPVAARLAGH